MDFPDFSPCPLSVGLRAQTQGRTQEAIKTMGPFDGTTTYRLDFVEKEIPSREQDCVECDSCDEEAPVSYSVI